MSDEIKPEVTDLDGIPVRPIRDTRLKPQTAFLPQPCSEFLDLLTGALCRARPNIRAIAKNAKGAYGRYATLDEVIDATGPAFAAAGLSITSQTIIVGDEEWLVTTLAHTSGQFQRCMSRLVAGATDYQKKLSAATYLRRLHFSSLAGVAADSDNDGAGLAPEPAKPSGFALAKQALAAAKTNKDRDTVVARAALSVPAGRLTEEQLEELIAERDRLNGKEAAGAK
jgi:hypothetical protein